MTTCFFFFSAVTRVIGNHKGVLTRTRQPKMAAYILKKRYEDLEAAEKETILVPRFLSSFSYDTFTMS